MYIKHKYITNVYTNFVKKYWIMNTINIIINCWTSPTDTIINRLTDICFLFSDLRKSASCQPSRSTKCRLQLLSYSLLDHWVPLWLFWTSGGGRFAKRIEPNDQKKHVGLLGHSVFGVFATTKNTLQTIEGRTRARNQKNNRSYTAI